MIIQTEWVRIEYTPHDPRLDWQLGTTLQHNDPVEKSQSMLKKQKKMSAI